MDRIGCRYGTHRVLEPTGALPQAAQRISSDMEIWDNEILIDVQALNIDSASFTQIRQASGGDVLRMKEAILAIVEDRGKMQNPVTGSGGMLIGTVERIGDALKDKIDLAPGDKIATLVSLSLTPLRIDAIHDVNLDVDRVEVAGKAVLFESGIYAKLPMDMSENLALAALDIAGAPAQTAKLVRPGDAVLILGAGGKSGMMCCYEAKKRVGPTGHVVGVVVLEEDKRRLLEKGLCHDVVVADATKPMEVLRKALEANAGEEYDLTMNVVNVPNTEMSTVLPARDGGTVYFFSMATSFTKAALGAEGVGKDVHMVIGNGYTKDHAAITLELLRESAELRSIFEETYC